MIYIIMNIIIFNAVNNIINKIYIMMITIIIVIDVVILINLNSTIPIDIIIDNIDFSDKQGI